MDIEKNRSLDKEDEAKEDLDSGLICLVTAARILGIPADYAQLKCAFCDIDRPLDLLTLLRAAKQIELKAKHTSVNMEKLPRVALPAILILNNGDYGIVMRRMRKKSCILTPGKNARYCLRRRS